MARGYMLGLNIGYRTVTWSAGTDNDDDDDDDDDDYYYCKDGFICSMVIYA